MGMALTLIHCVLFVILGLVITEPFIGLFTKEPEVMKQACDYTYIVLCFSFGSLLQIAMEKTLSGHRSNENDNDTSGSRCND